MHDLTLAQRAALRTLLSAPGRAVIRRGTRWRSRFVGGESFGSKTLAALLKAGLVEKHGERLATLTPAGVARAEEEAELSRKAGIIAREKSRASAATQARSEAFFIRERDRRRRAYAATLQIQTVRLPYADN